MNRKLPGPKLDRLEVSKTVRGFIEKRRPKPALREKLDYGFYFDGRSVELFEIRPHFQNREKKIRGRFAKATYVRNRNRWKVYWRRASGKWHIYEPSEVSSLDAFLKIVYEDKDHCFFG